MNPEDCKRNCNGPDCEGCRDFEPITQKAYTQLIEGKVMVSTLPKPDIEDYRIYNLEKTLLLGWRPDYEIDKKAFESSILGEVENVDWVKDENTQILETFERPIIVFDWDSQKIEWFKPNQPCEVEKSGDKYIITKL